MWSNLCRECSLFSSFSCNCVNIQIYASYPKKIENEKFSFRRQFPKKKSYPWMYTHSSSEIYDIFVVIKLLITIFSLFTQSPQHIYYICLSNSILDFITSWQLTKTWEIDTTGYFKEHFFAIGVERVMRQFFFHPPSNWYEFSRGMLIE